MTTAVEKTDKEGLIGKVSGVLFGVALLIFLLIGFFHGGWAWAWIIPVGAFVGLIVFRLIFAREDVKEDTAKE